MNRPTIQSGNVREAWDVFVRFRWRFVLPLFAVAASVLVFSMFLPRKYEAEAVFERRNDMVLSEITNRGASQNFQAPRNSAIDEVAGGAAIDGLVSSLRHRAEKDPSIRPVLNDVLENRTELSRWILVRYDVSSSELDRVRVSLITDNANLSRTVVNTLIENYIKRTRLGMEQRLQQSADFFQAEADGERKKIEKIEDALLAFEVNHSELLPENPANLQTTLSQNTEALSALEQKLNSAQLRQESLKKSLDATSPTSPSIMTSRNPDLTRLETKLRDLQANLTLYTSVYKMTDKHPDLLALREQIEAVKGQIDKTDQEVVTQKRISLNPQRAEIELMLTNAAAEREALQNECSIVKDRVTKLNAQAAGMFNARADYRKLTRQAGEHQRQLAFWEDNLRRVKLALTAENGDRGVKLNFIKPCELPTRPISPDLTQVLMAAVVLGLLAGGANVFLAHRNDQSFLRGEEIAKATSLPLFGSVSEIISAEQRRFRRIKQLLLYPANVAVMCLVLSALATMLYMDLERPELFDRFKQSPTRFLIDRFATNFTGGTGPDRR